MKLEEALKTNSAFRRRGEKEWLGVSIENGLIVFEDDLMPFLLTESDITADDYETKNCVEEISINKDNLTFIMKKHGIDSFIIENILRDIGQTISGECF